MFDGHTVVRLVDENGESVTLYPGDSIEWDVEVNQLEDGSILPDYDGVDSDGNPVKHVKVTRANPDAS